MEADKKFQQAKGIIARAVTEFFGISESEMRDSIKPRGAYSHFCVTILGQSQRALAEEFNLSGSAIGSGIRKMTKDIVAIKEIESDIEAYLSEAEEAGEKALGNCKECTENVKESKPARALAYKVAPPEDAEINQPVSKCREAILRFQQKDIAGDMTKAQSSRPSELLDEDTIFRFGYVPFVIAEIGWDYIDSMLDLCAILRLDEYKKKSREMRNIRDEYLRVRREVYHGGEQHENENMLMFKKELKGEFKQAWNEVETLVSDGYPSIDSDFSLMICSGYMAQIILGAMFCYSAAMTKKVEDIVGHGIGNILPHHIRDMFKLCHEFVRAYPLGDEYEEIRTKHQRVFVRWIHQIEMNKREEEYEREAI